MRLLPRAFLILAILAMLVRFSASRPKPADDEIAIIVNKTNTVTVIPPALVQKVFMGDKTSWPNGRRVVVLMLPAGDPWRNGILHLIYKMNDGAYTKYFMQAAFTGRVQVPPRDVASAAEMKKQVAYDPGAVRYVQKRDLDDSVKVVLTVP